MTDVEILMDIYDECDEATARWRLTEDQHIHLIIRAFRAGYEKGYENGFSFGLHGE